MSYVLCCMSYHPCYGIMTDSIDSYFVRTWWNLAGGAESRSDQVEHIFFIPPSDLIFTANPVAIAMAGQYTK